MSSRDSIHRTVRVTVGPWSEEIDEEIAPLIHEIWIAGIETMMSCQEDGLGKVWLDFPDMDNMVKFLNIVAHFEPGPETLYNRMNTQLQTKNPENDWWYEIYPNDFSHIEDESGEADDAFDYDGPPDFHFTCSVRFPPADLAIVLERMRECNRTTTASLEE